MLRTYRSPIEHIPRVHTGYNFPRGTTEVLDQVRETFKDAITVTTIQTPTMADV